MSTDLPGPELDFFPIQFHASGSFQDVIDFRHLLVVMGPTVGRYIHDVHGGDGIVLSGEGPPSLSAGTGGGSDIGKVREQVVLFVVHEGNTLRKTDRMTTILA